MSTLCLAFLGFCTLPTLAHASEYQRIHWISESEMDRSPTFTLLIELAGGALALVTYSSPDSSLVPSEKLVPIDSTWFLTNSFKPAITGERRYTFAERFTAPVSGTREYLIRRFSGISWTNVSSVLLSVQTKEKLQDGTVPEIDETDSNITASFSPATEQARGFRDTERLRSNKFGKVLGEPALIIPPEKTSGSHQINEVLSFFRSGEMRGPILSRFLVRALPDRKQSALLSQLRHDHQAMWSARLLKNFSLEAFDMDDSKVLVDPRMACTMQMKLTPDRDIDVKQLSQPTPSNNILRRGLGQENPTEDGFNN